MRSDKIFGRLLRDKNFLIAAICLFILVTTFTLNSSAQSVEAILNDRVDSDKAKVDESNLIEGEISIVDNPLVPQVANSNTYTFNTTTSGSLTDMSSGTTQLVAANSDDVPSAVTNIGFDFYFMGVRYSQFSANSNGLIRLGATSVQSASPYKPLAQAGIPLITPYGADQRTHTTGVVRSRVIGAAPNRVLIVEWFNMQADFNSGGTINLGYQARLSETTGVIEFVYGSMTMSTAGAADANSRDPNIGFSSSNTAGTVGSVIAAQSGAPSPTFDGTSATATANLYTAGSIVVLSGATDGTRRTFSFTPPFPNAPGPLSFTAVTAISQTLNWADNSGNEDLFAIYRSTDGINYSYIGAAAENATTFNDTGLVPSTNYFYRVFAVSEGALSTALSGSSTTGAPGNDTCNGTGGNWNTPATWADGSVPTATDNVTIGSGCTVAIDTAAVALNVTVQSGGILEFESATARTLTTTFAVTINSGGTLRSNSAGTVTIHQLVVGTDLTNNGTLDLSTNGDTAGAELRFNGAANNSFSGTGATTDLRLLTINKGSGTITPTSPTLDINLSNMSVRGLTSGGIAGFLNTATFNGIVRFSGTNTFSDVVFQTAGYSIPSTAGVALNNPNFTVAGLNGSPTLTGLLRVSNGTFNIGTATDNSMGFSTGSRVIVEGGTVNAAGRFGVSAATSAINYTQTAGTVTVQTAGNTSTTLAGFDLGTSLTSNISLTGGTIVVQLPNTAVSGPRDYRNQAGTGIVGVTGGTLQLGNGNSGTAKAYTMRGVVPNLILTNTSANHTAQWDITATNYNNISRDITISSGTTLNLGNIIFLFNGTTLTNNGTLTHNGASSNTVIFTDNAPVLYTGSGAVTAPLSALSIQSTQGFTIDAASPNIVANAVRLFAGNVINSNKIVVGNGGATTSTVQIGNTTTPTAAGTFDQQVGFNAGTGGIILSYLRTTASRVTGGEIPATRTITNLTYDDNDVTHTLTLAGGNLTVTGALTLTNGIVLTGANTLIHNGAATRTNGFVNGNLSRSYTATGAYTYFVGQNGYSPVLATVSAVTGASSLTVRAVDNTLPGLNSANSASRYWTLTESGDLTADLAFTYLDADVNGTEADYRIYRLESGSLTNQCSGGSCANTTSNTATVTGVTNFSDWGIGEAGAAVPGSLAFANGTPSIGESAGTATITVNRTGGSAGSVTVNYATVAGGTATGGGTCAVGVDYLNASGTLTFANGVTSQTFPVTICPDSTDEPDETVNLALSNLTGGATPGAQSTAVLTILDDDVAQPGFLQFSSPTYTVAEDGVSATITVNRVGGSDGSVSANYATVTGGTATSGTACGTAGVDYVTTSGTVTFGNGVTAPQTFTVPVCTDTASENSETVNLNLSQLNVTDGANLGNSQTTAVLTITDVPPPATCVATVLETEPNDTSATANVLVGNRISGAISPGSDFDFYRLNNVPAGAVLFTMTDTGDGPTNNSGTTNSRDTVITVFAGDGTTVIEEDDDDGTGNGGNGTSESGVASALSGRTLTAGGTYYIRVRSFGSSVINQYNLHARFVLPTATTAEVEPNNTSGTATALALNTMGTGSVSSVDTDFFAVSLTANNVAQFYLDGDPERNAGTTANVDHELSLIAPDGTSVLFNTNSGGTVNSSTNPEAEGFNFYIPTTGIYFVRVQTVSSTGEGTYRILASQTDCNAQPNPTISINDVSQVEGNSGTSAFSFTVSLSAASSQTVTVDYATADGTATAVGNDYTAISATTVIFAPGETTKTVSVIVNGDTTVELDETFFVNLTNPTNATISDNQGLGTIQNDDVPTLAINDVSQIEGNSGTSTFAFTVSLSQASPLSVTVNYATANNTATAGSDYTAASGTLTFAPGETTKPVNVSVTGDTIVELNETFFVNLTAPTNATISDNQGLGTIQNDDVPTLSINDVSQIEGNSGTSTFAFTVTLSQASPLSVSVNYATANGTATTADNDYTATSGTLTFAPGETTKTVNVTVNGDTTLESDETFFVNLTTPTNATIADNQGLGTIQNDDTPSLSIANVSQIEGNSGTSNFVFTVSLSQASNQTVTVNYATADGTATVAGNDYNAASGTLTFAPGTLTRTVAVAVRGDINFELNETFFVNLSGATNATIFDNQAVGLIINDDGQSFRINDVRIVEGNSGTSLATFTVTLTPDPTRPEGASAAATVQYETMDGTAAFPRGDYLSAEGTLIFNPGDTQKTIQVIINGDTVKEANEFFFVNLFNPVNAAVADEQAAGIIIDEDRAYSADFDFDRHADYSVFRPNTGTWYVFQSTNGVPVIRNFGANGDIAVPGDYDGDAVADRAVFRPSEGNWYITGSGGKVLTIRQFGLAGDKPVQGDYDGDGRTDLAVFRPSNGVWYVLRSSDNSVSIVRFGLGTDVPVTGDFDGDFKNDLALFRNGVWYVLKSSDNGVSIVNFGINGDRPVSGDFDGDGRTDFAIYRNGAWWILPSLSGSFYVVNFGIPTDIPSPADYDGDGTSDVAVFRPADGDWYVLRSSDNQFTGIHWGQNGDVPIPSAYTPRP